MSELDPSQPSYEELAALVVGLTAQLGQARARIVECEARIAQLQARLGRDSTNSSSPPSQDPPAAKGKRRSQRSQRVRSKDRKPGGQPGHTGWRVDANGDTGSDRDRSAAAAVLRLWY